jgi:hypothetical protein
MSTINVDEAGQAAEFHEIVQGVSITHLLQQRDAVLERLTQAFRTLQEAHGIAMNAHLGFPNIVASKDYRGQGRDVIGQYATDGEALTLCRAAIDAAAWRYLMQESGMRSLMSASKRSESTTWWIRAECRSSPARRSTLPSVPCTIRERTCSIRV